MREAHERMAEAIRHIPDGRLLEPVMAEWTGKDLLAHMAWWHDHSVLVIEGLRAGRQPYEETDPANSTDALNERTHREHADDPPEQVIVVERPEHLVSGAARNLGARQANGDILVFVDADVEVHPDAFVRIRAAFDAH